MFTTVINDRQYQTVWIKPCQWRSFVLRRWSLMTCNIYFLTDTKIVFVIRDIQEDQKRIRCIRKMDWKAILYAHTMHIHVSQEVIGWYSKDEPPITYIIGVNGRENMGISHISSRRSTFGESTKSTYFRSGYNWGSLVYKCINNDFTYESMISRCTCLYLSIQILIL